MTENVLVELPNHLQFYSENQTVHIPGRTVRELLEALGLRFTGFPRLFDEQSRLRPGIRVFVNQTTVTDIDRLLPPCESVRIALAPVARESNGRCPPGRLGR